MDNVFLDIVELTQGTDAESIYNSLRQSFRQMGLDNEVLGKHLISIATEGTLVLSGKTTGMVSRLKRNFSNIQSIHCLACCLEYAIHDSLKGTAGCNHFGSFLSKLYSLYHLSAKNPRLFEEATAYLNMQILRIGQIFTIRWVVSSFNILQVVWKSYPALERHFKTADRDTSHGDTERKTLLRPHKHLTKSVFAGPPT